MINISLWGNKKKYYDKNINITFLANPPPKTLFAYLHIQLLLYVINVINWLFNSSILPVFFAI